MTKPSAATTIKAKLVHNDGAAPLTFPPSSLVPTATKLVQRHLTALIVLLSFVASTSAFVSRGVLVRKCACSLSTTKTLDLSPYTESAVPIKDCKPRPFPSRQCHTYKKIWESLICSMGYWDRWTQFSPVDWKWQRAMCFRTRNWNWPTGGWQSRVTNHLSQDLRHHNKMILSNLARNKYSAAVNVEHLPPETSWYVKFVFLEGGEWFLCMPNAPQGGWWFTTWPNVE